MKKTLVTFIITILILMASITHVQGLSFAVKITPNNANVEKGGTVKLVLSVANLDVGANGLNTFLATMEYDQTVFEIATSNNIKSLNGWDAPTYNAGNGKILTSKGAFVNSESDVLEITLTAKANAKTGSTTVTFKNIEASNSKEDIVAPNTSYILNIVEKSQSGGNSGTQDAPSSGTTTDKEKPTISVSYRNVTNGVQVTLTSNEPLKATDGWTLSTDKKQLSKVYTSNFSGSITVEDVAGNKSDAVTVNVQVKTEGNGDNGGNNNPPASGTTVDKTKPTATVSYSKATNGTVTVTVKASEEIQPVTGWTLSTDKKTLTRQYKANHTGTITLVDLAGNKSDAISIKVDISNANGGTNSGTNTGNNTGTSNTNKPSKLPQAGLETYLIPAIGLIAIIGTVAFVRYKSMEY